MPDRIWYPPRTRLETVWRVHVDEAGVMGWHLFHSCPDRNASYLQMLGPGTLLRDDGVAIATNWQPGKVVEYQIYPQETS